MLIGDWTKERKKHQIWFKNHIWYFMRVGLEFKIRNVECGRRKLEKGKRTAGPPSSQRNGTMARQAFGIREVGKMVCLFSHPLPFVARAHRELRENNFFV